MGIPDIRILWSDDPRITSQFKDIDSKYKEVSKYPPIVRDISFIVDKSVSLNNYFEIVRDVAGDLIEEFKLIDTFENDKKFGKGKVSYTFRIIYRSLERTLTNEEVNALHDKIRAKTQAEFGATLR
jgi:phenylalanyl-tRNA synthetase alpha chain